MPQATYTIRRKVFQFLGAAFHIHDANGALVGYCKQKAFKLKEDIRIYGDESMRGELVRIEARQIIDFGASYDVLDGATGAKLGALRRKGLKSLLRDHWEVLDRDDRPAGTIQEDGLGLALLRRFLSNLIPQTLHLRSDGGAPLATYRVHFNPFVHRLTTTVEAGCPFDQRLVLASALLLLAIEGRQE